MLYDAHDTICALSTAPGIGGIAVIRVSGSKSISIAESFFSRPLKEVASHQAVFGRISKADVVVDEVVLTLFRGRRSFTGEDTVEISCHGSRFIQEEILRLLTHAGARIAKPGEFTMRAFMNGKMDLSQAEAVADLIASESAAAHKLAMHQMRGGFSAEINELREKLIHFASLIELELDFAEEDVEFANRQDLKDLVDKIKQTLSLLIDSFATGKVIKNGVPVAIIGRPNAGKSTLLNALLKEEKAIVTEIAGTTRDAIEDVTSIEGVQFRFIDTAGLRETTDTIEAIGVQRSFEKMKGASIVLYLYDAHVMGPDAIEEDLADLRERIKGTHAHLEIVANKCDDPKHKSPIHGLPISAKSGEGLEALKEKLLSLVNIGLIQGDQTVVTNARHYEALTRAHQALSDVRNGLDRDITGDFLAIDIRKSLHHLGEITGAISTDDLLDNIFSKFCIGK